MQFEWQSAEPESLGMDTGALERMWRNLERRGTRALLVIRHDRVLFERYGDGWDAGKPHFTASLAKALVGGMSLALAMDGGLIAPDDLACRTVPEWSGDPLKSKITIRHLASHTSGIEDAEFTERERAECLARGITIRDPHRDIPGWKGAFWRQDENPFLLARDQAPVLFHPGTASAYSNPGMAMLAYAVTAALREAPATDIRSLLRERLMEPLGIAPAEWAVGYGRTFETDGLPLVANWGGGSFTARAVARIGRLMLRLGNWEGRELLKPATVRALLRHSGTPSSAGLAWWVNSDLAGEKVWPALPADAFVGSGAQNQVLCVVPSLGLILVRSGTWLDPDDARGAAYTHLYAPLMGAVLDRTPYPPSTLVTAVEWAPTCTITRLATGERTRDGSDNWPMTWAEDDHLHTAYGDGYGFEPSLPKKLGMGFARVEGMPGDFRGRNIRSSGENSGYGASGKKASGLLALGGVLYILARNADGDGSGSQIAWSEDGARTWTWCDWHFAELGHPTFANYGRGCRDARDGFVYVLSHDHPSAYRPADRFVLARVPRESIRDRARYEFFTGMDAAGRAQWSADIAERGAIFTDPGRCGRASVSYNAGLGRYLLWQGLPNVPDGDRRDAVIDTRYEGGFALYEGPEPWGPWRTLFHTEKWDVGPGELGCFPTKWMSADGTTLHLVFSGNDNFSVRKVVLQVSRGS